ncbi:O-antigen ligase family protein [Lacinutrix undariae]
MKISKIVNKGVVYSAFLFSFFIAFSVKLANVSLIAFYVFSVSAYFVNKPTISSGSIKVLKFSSLLFLASILFSVFSHAEFELIFKGIGRRITFLLSPLVFLLLSNDNISVIKEKALKGLVLGVFLSSVFLVINIFYEYYLTRPLFTIDKDIFNFYHTNYYFTRILDIHPSYYGMFVIAAISVVYFYKGFSNKIMNIAFVVLSAIIVLFLNARIILFLFFILNSVYLIRYFYIKTNKFLQTALLTIAVFMVTSFILFFATKNTYAYQRVFKETLWELSDSNKATPDFKVSGESRMLRWGAAVQIIKEKPLLGYGVFKEREVLCSEYLKRNMQSSYQRAYNAHNQFLGFTIEGGLVSGAILVLFFLTNFYISFKRKDILYAFFVFSVLSICLIENYLIRNAGVIFISFFSSLYLYNQIEK